jgi:hypothetical protein
MTEPASKKQKTAPTTEDEFAAFLSDVNSTTEAVTTTTPNLDAQQAAEKEVAATTAEENDDAANNDALYEDDSGIEQAGYEAMVGNMMLKAQSKLKAASGSSSNNELNKIIVDVSEVVGNSNEGDESNEQQKGLDLVAIMRAKKKKEKEERKKKKEERKNRAADEGWRQS